MNWYILYVISLKTEWLLEALHKHKDMDAFVPEWEYYRRDKQSWETKPMFPGYIFIKSSLTQDEFDYEISKIPELKDGVIRQLKYKDTGALRDEEIDMLEKQKGFELYTKLDEDYILRLSFGYIENDKAIIYKGPLKYYEDNIVKVDKHNRIAYLSISFMDRYVQAGLFITGKIYI